MTRFENKLCPVCRTRFNEKADVVCCPICGTPHHRACYSIKNKCALEEFHAKGWSWNGYLPDEEPETPKAEVENSDATVTAQIDGQPDSHRAEYPSGTPFDEEKRMFEEQLGEDNPFKEMFDSLTNKEIGEDGVSMHELVSYSATNVYHYGKAFNIFRANNGGKKRIVSFNFCSGILAPMFQFYRRMNFFGVIALLLTLLPSIIVVAVPEQIRTANSQPLIILLRLLQIVIPIFMCLFSDYIYYRHCVKSILKFRKSYDGDTKSDEYYMSLYEKGRPTMAGGLIGLLAMSLGEAYIMALMGMI